MKTEYYENLLKKLKEGFHKSKPQKKVKITLEFREMEDLLILWEQEAKNKWSLTDSSSAEKETKQ